MKGLTLKVLSVVSCLLLFFGCSSSDHASGPENKVLFAVYMVGSDLETDGDFATDDLMDMVQGYDQLSTLEQNSLDVQVAFGGSLKETWNGVRYADMNCLKQDSMDGVFGNDSCYSYTALLPSKSPEDMSDRDTLIQFMNDVNLSVSGYDTVVMDFWDHGGSYFGYGNDENFGSTSLSNTDIKNAFESSGFRPDIIGFDACLMASAEVINKLYPYSDYIVAAEESEPGHGWDYNLLIGSAGSTLNAQALAQSIVDGFIDSPAHMFTTGKTLSVIDTSAYAAFQTSLDSLAAELELVVAAEFSKLIKSNQLTEKYSGLSMDLTQYLANLKVVIPALSTEIDDVAGKLADTIIYSRQDGSRKNANGLSIFSFSRNIWEGGYYTEERSCSTAWYSFVSSLMTYDDADVTAPVVTPVNLSFCGKSPGVGTCYEITDDFGIQSSKAVLAADAAGEDTYDIISMTSLEWTSGDYYYLETINRKALQVCSDDDFCFTANSFSNKNMTQYKFKAIVQQNFSIVNVEFFQESFVDYWVTNSPLHSGELDPKDDVSIEAGDLVLPIALKLFFDDGNWAYSDHIIQGFYTFTETPTFSLIEADPAAEEFIMVVDAQGNICTYDTAGVIQPLP